MGNSWHPASPHGVPGSGVLVRCVCGRSLIGYRFRVEERATCEQTVNGTNQIAPSLRLQHQAFGSDLTNFIGKPCRFMHRKHQDLAGRPESTIRAAASRPLSFGMVMSSTMTSGFTVRQASTACSPSVASPAICHSGRDLVIRVLIPSRTIS